MRNTKGVGTQEPMRMTILFKPPLRDKLFVTISFSNLLPQSKVISKKTLSKIGLIYGIDCKKKLIMIRAQLLHKKSSKSSLPRSLIR